MKISAPTIILILIGCVCLFFLANRLISEHALVSFDEYMASTTSTVSTTTISSQLRAQLSSQLNALFQLDAPFAGVPSDLLDRPDTTLHIGDKSLHVVIATTTTEQERGLSFHSRLGPHQGMLFVFPTASSYNFWMKDMSFPLDMVWIDDSFKIIGVRRDADPVTYPDTFSPPSPVRYVIEVDAGVADKIGLVEGVTLGL